MPARMPETSILKFWTPTLDIGRTLDHDAVGVFESDQLGAFTGAFTVTVVLVQVAPNVIAPQPVTINSCVSLAPWFVL